VLTTRRYCRKKCFLLDPAGKMDAIFEVVREELDDEGIVRRLASVEGVLTPDSPVAMLVKCRHF
jgi:hypothetical protein